MISFTIPGKTKNTLNLREHHMVKAKRAKRERAKTMMLCPHWVGGPLMVVTLTRYGMGTMDDDGLRAALKHIRDGVAGRLKVDDASPLVKFEYAPQQKCKAGAECVRVDVVRVERGAT